MLIPYSQFEVWRTAPDNKGIYENGFLVLIKPQDYFNNKNITEELAEKGLKLGKNTLLFYERK